MLFDNIKTKKMKSIQSFKKKKFDAAKYVKNFYVEDGVAYISCNVESLDEIISHYSIKDYEWLNKDFAEYIETNAYYIPVEYPITIEICGHNFNGEERALISTVIKDYFGLKLGNKQIDFENNTRKASILLILSLVTFGFTFLFIRLAVIKAISEWILILFWFFVWEFAEVIILDRNELSTEKLEAAQLASVKVIFSDIIEEHIEEQKDLREKEIDDIF